MKKTQKLIVDIVDAIKKTKLEDWPNNGSKESVLINLGEALESAEVGDCEQAQEWIQSAFSRNAASAFEATAIQALFKKYA